MSALQQDLFGAPAIIKDGEGAVTPPSAYKSADPIVGLAATLPSSRPCLSCGNLNVTIESTGKNMHHGSFRCSCGRFRGWLSKQTYEFLTETINKFGRPTEPVVILPPPTPSLDSEDAVTANPSTTPTE